jgi:hypothetical protein
MFHTLYIKKYKTKRNPERILGRSRDAISGGVSF